MKSYRAVFGTCLKTTHFEECEKKMKKGKKKEKKKERKKKREGKKKRKKREKKEPSALINSVNQINKYHSLRLWNSHINIVSCYHTYLGYDRFKLGVQLLFICDLNVGARVF